MAHSYSLQAAIDEALTCFELGRFEDMEIRTRHFLRSFPQSAVLHELLGMALMAQFRASESITYLEAAIRIDPTDPQFWENLGECQRQLRKFANAETSLRHALALRPNWPSSLSALAQVLAALGRHNEAQATSAMLHSINPHFAAEDRRARQHALQIAITAAPTNADLYDDLGLLCLQGGEFQAAEANFRTAINCDPRHTRAQLNLATLLKRQGRQPEAHTVAREMLGHFGYPNESMAADQLDDIVRAALLLDEVSSSSDTARICASVHTIKPDASLALATAFAARKACDWDLATSFEKLALERLHQTDLRFASNFALLCLPRATPIDQLNAARTAASQFVVSAGTKKAPSLRITPKRLRVSYFSRDFYHHATSALLTGVIELHNRERFEIIAHDFSPPSNDQYRQRLTSAFDRIIPIAQMPDQEAARQIQADGVDILIDINSWVPGNRAHVIAGRPAKLQIQWLGYPGTSGASWIDYMIADPVVVPKGQESYYSEKIIRLPHCYQPNDNKRQISPSPTRQFCGLPEEEFVFCCFNQAFKITPEIFGAWMRLLRKVPRSILWLLDPGDAVRQTLPREATAFGIAPERLVFAPRVDAADHLARISQADLALDCFPYGSHTTASDALWAGVPLVAFQGETFASRASSSVLNAAGLPELITSSIEEYETCATKLAEDRTALIAIRARLKANARSCPLFDTPAFTHDLERALEVAWIRYRDGLSPDHIEIAKA
jgi:predicted O-linked N-acetylglucosamine transferase (SPINDLY family)